MRRLYETKHLPQLRRDHDGELEFKDAGGHITHVDGRRVTSPIAVSFEATADRITAALRRIAVIAAR